MSYKKTMTLEQFNTWYWKTYPASTYRRGQAFCNIFIDIVDDKIAETYHKLYYSESQEEITNLIWKLMLQRDICPCSMNIVRRNLITQQ